MAKKFSWKIARLTIIKTFLYSFFTPMVGIEIMLDIELLQAMLVSLISSLIMCGTMLAQIIDRYVKFLEVNNNGRK